MRSGAGASAGRNRQGPPNRSASEDRTRPCPPGTRPCASFRRRSPAGAMGGPEERTGKSALGRLAGRARRDDCRANGDRGRGHAEERLYLLAAPGRGQRERAPPPPAHPGPPGSRAGRGAPQRTSRQRSVAERESGPSRTAAHGGRSPPPPKPRRGSAPCRQRRRPAPAASADPSPRDETALASGRPSGRWRRQPPPAERIIRRSPARQGAERRGARRAGAALTSGSPLGEQAARSQAARRLASRAAAAVPALARRRAASHRSLALCTREIAPTSA